MLKKLTPFEALDVRAPLVSKNTGAIVQFIAWIHGNDGPDMVILRGSLLSYGHSDNFQKNVPGPVAGRTYTRKGKLAPVRVVFADDKTIVGYRIESDGATSDMGLAWPMSDFTRDNWTEVGK